MAQRFDTLNERLTHFIAEQKIFFVSTAPADGRVNLSPKGMDSLRVLDDSTVAWLNMTGSGNETAAHVQENGRMTLMFCAFEGNPLILRLYGTATVYHQHDAEWAQWYGKFEPIPGARQVFVLNIEIVQTSCGMAVPLFDYQGERELLRDWAAKKGDAGIRAYWEEKNQLTLDGKPTGVLCKPT